jgi:hypothetical protein
MFVPATEPLRPASGTPVFTHRVVRQAEIAHVTDGSLVQVRFCTRNNERSIDRGIGVHVTIAELDLIPT